MGKGTTFETSMAEAVGEVKIRFEKVVEMCNQVANGPQCMQSQWTTWKVHVSTAIIRIVVTWMTALPAR